MQFHQNGFRTGDPDVHPAAPGHEGGQGPLPEKVDVLIVGCGPAGLTLATQLSAFPGIVTRIVEQKSGPLELGQADGVACRTVEMFQAFGFAERVLREAYWVNETAFWTPDPARPDEIVRTGRIDDTEEGLSEFPHVILNQARVHQMYLDIMRRSPSRLEPDYSRKFAGLQIDPSAEDHPVTVRLERVDPGHEGEVETVRARYVVGCDGARSGVRRALGLELKGDSANQAWGVMDVLAVTDYPDIRLKTVVRSASEGSMVIIPREGGHLVRLYVEMDELARDERVASRNITSNDVIAAARRVLHPHTLDVKEIAWWSVYEIGQRLTDRFDDVPAEERGERLPRIFITGDACHTHSPKAGQGMNVSMQDAFNLGWKLAAVLEGRSGPDLLATYSAERQAVAKELIDFDKEWASILSAPLKTDTEDGIDPAETQAYFQRHGRYTAGTATRYRDSPLNGDDTHQHLAAGLLIGMRFHSAPVVRLGDAKPMELGHAATADGRWRLYAFAGKGDIAGPGSPLHRLCAFLESDPASPVRRHGAAGADIDSAIDLRAILQAPHRDLDVMSMPPLLLPSTGRLGLRDYEKVFCPDFRRGDIFNMRGIDREKGCIVVVRPDQYVAHVLPLDAHEALSGYFAPILLPQR